MPRYQVAVDDEVLHGLMSGGNGLGRLVEQVLDKILEARVSEHLGAQPYERTEERKGYRNGHRSRKLVTRVGALTLRIPQVRDGEFSTDLFRRYQRSERRTPRRRRADGDR